MSLHLLKNADVYAPEPLGLQHLLIAGDRLVWMGEEVPALDPCLPVQVHDLQGLRLLPGLIDAHTHIIGGGGEDGYASRVPAVGLSRYTKAGITTVVGVLGTDDLTRSTQSLVTQARALDEEGLSAFCYTGGYHLPLTTLSGSARSDIVFIDKIIGIGELALSDHRSSQPSLNEVLRLASEAHVAGLMSGKAGIVHFHLGDGQRGLSLINQALDSAELPARVFHPTHINRNEALFVEALALSHRGCYVDITAFAQEHAPSRGVLPSEAVLRYFAAGCPASQLTVSTDGGGCLPEFDSQGNLCHMGIGDPITLFECLRAVVEKGLTLPEALPPFSANVADLLKLTNKGRVAVGLDADFCLIDAQFRHWGTMARGQWHVKQGQCLRRGQFE